MKPRLFIVDDEAPARKRLITLLSDIAADCPHELVGEAGHAQSALDGIAANNPDLVLLDVQMPGITGIELAAHLSSQPGGGPAIIFVTAYDEYALKAFDLQAIDYLLKPVRASRLAEAIRRVSDLRFQSRLRKDALAATASALKSTRQNFSIQERGRLLLVPVTDVVYLKAELKYVTLRTTAREYLIEESLMSIEEELASAFVRVHRNALVARSAIIGVERASHAIDMERENDVAQDGWQLILRGVDERLPVSRRQWALVKALVR
jgi:two-component system response regulator AlgR